MTAATPDRWHSLYMFYGRPDHAETLMLFAARELERLGWAPDDWFFIRYPEGGPHVRLRAGSTGPADIAPLRASLARRCRALADEEPATAWARTIAGPDGEGRIHPPGHVADVAYEPETTRYGGPEALIENERLFRVSSAIALQLFEGVPPADPRRTALAIDLMLVATAAMALDDAGASRFFHAYEMGWRTLWGVGSSTEVARPATKLNARLAELRRACGAEGETRSLVQHWGRALRGACRTFEVLAARGVLIMPQTGKPVIDDDDLAKATQSIVASQIHMLNNRIGIWPSGEIVLSANLTARL